MLTWLREHPLRVGLAILMAIFAVLYATLDVDNLYHIIRALALAVSGGMVVSYTPAAWSFLRQKTYLSTGQGLALGVWLTWTGIAGHMSNAILAQVFPHSFSLHSLLAATCGWTAISGGFLQLSTSEGVVGGIIPTRAQIMLGTVVCITIAVAALMIMLGLPMWWRR